jgi:predicted RNA-binding Zn-ribbon protein involved in translation (DUF1610 family)
MSGSPHLFEEFQIDAVTSVFICTLCGESTRKRGTSCRRTLVNYKELMRAACREAGQAPPNMDP